MTTRSREQSLQHNVLRGSIGAVLLGLLALGAIAFGSDKSQDLVEAIMRADPVMLGLAFLCFVLAHFADAMRLLHLSRAAGERIGLRRSLSIVLASDFAALVTPFMSGGPTCNLWMLHRSGISVATCSALIVTGTAIARFVVSALALSLPFLMQYSMQSGAVAGASSDLLRNQLLAVVPVNLGIGVFMLLAAYHVGFVSNLLRAIETRWVRHSALTAVLTLVQRNVQAFHGSIKLILQNGYGDAARSAIYSLVHFALQFSMAYLVLIALGLSAPYPVAVAAEMIILLVASATPTPGGSGAAELVIAAIIGRIIPHATLAAFVILWRLSTYYFMITMGGIAFLLEIRHSRDDHRR